MLKNVLQAIPAYAMSCFLLPKSLCEEIQRVMNAFWWQNNSTSNKGIRWLSWQKMCMMKNNGGLGFRDIKGFNIALLSKQCWKLVNEPDSLMARVLKAKYYPNSHFLQANRKGGDSYTWSGIWEAKEEMKKGLRWVVGDGKSIKILEDRWLRLKEDFCVDKNRVTGDVKHLIVSDFFLENTKTWDVNKLNNHFCSEDVAAMVKTRIPQRYTTDRVAWTHSKNGKYTVKSGYFQWCEHHVNVNEVQQSKGWSVIWKLEVPHKTKVFLWRFCRNTLPVRYLLRGRGIQVPVTCTMCTGEIEHLRHLFFECQFARNCWYYMGVDVDSWDIEDSSEWLLRKLANGPKQELIKISTVLAGVWFTRNKNIFEHKSMTSEAVMEWSKKQISDWREATAKWE